jgi:signal transduction histidine kinase
MRPNLSDALEIRRDRAHEARLLRGLGLTAVPFAILILFRGLLGVPLTPSTYLPLHTLLETLVVVVCFSTFAVQFYAAGTRGLADARARFIGAVLLAVALIEILHVMAFPGMPGFFGPSSTSRGFYYWIMARLLSVAALVAARHLKPGASHPLLARSPLAATALGLAGLVVAVDLAFPGASAVFFVEGEGLTPLARWLDYGVAALAAVGAFSYWSGYRTGREKAQLRLCGALAITVLSQVCFSSYSDATDAFNLLGHVYQTVAFALVFDALFVAALLLPYRKLDTATQELSTRNAELSDLRRHVEEELAVTIARLEESTRAKEVALAELEAAIAAAPDGLVICSPAGQVLRENAAAERMLGYDAAMREMSAGARWKLLAPVDVEGKPLPLEEVPLLRSLAGETVRGTVLRLSPPSRKPIWVSVSAAPVRDPQGKLLGAVLALADIGQMVKLQEQREDLLRAVSHDLRNPLQIVMLQAERLYKGSALSQEARDRRVADSILAASRQMKGMIQDLVESARLETGNLHLTRSAVALQEHVQRLLTISAGILDPEKVIVEIPPDLPLVQADPARLDRIFGNLIGNAFKYGGPGPVSIRARARVDDGQVTISVSDDGPGIAPEDQPRVFDRFVRGTGQRSEGLGLGLYITRLLVEAHGGRIWVESAPGEGTTFSFTLPVAAVR